MSGPPRPSDAFLMMLDPEDPVNARKRYALLRLQLLGFFKGRRCPDPEELAAETLTRGLVAVTNGAVINSTITAYVWGIAKHVLSEHQKAAARGRVVSVEDAATSLADDSVRATEARIALREALDHLPLEERELLKRYFTEDRGELAHELGISLQALRVRVHRIRRGLREWIDRSRQ